MNKAQLLEKTKSELLALARQLGLRGISTLRKAALVERILHARAQRARSPARKAPKTTAAAAAKPGTGSKRRAMRKRSAAATAARRGRSRRRRAAVRRPPRAPARVGLPAGRPGSARGPVRAAALGPTPEGLPPPSSTESGSLPEAYGTGRVFLAARDPGWLHAQWDLSGAQLAAYRRQSADGDLVLRLFSTDQPHPLQEITLAPDSRGWYLPVAQPSTRYRVQLGYRRRGGGFHVISTSREAVTPAGGISLATGATFIALPVEVPLLAVLGYVRTHVADGEQMAYTLARLHAEGHPLPFKVILDVGAWSDERAARLLRALLGAGAAGAAGSAAIGELLRGRSASAAFSAATAPAARRRVARHRGGRS